MITKVRHRAHCPICGKCYWIWVVHGVTVQMQEAEDVWIYVNLLDKPVQCCGQEWIAWQERFMGKNWLVSPIICQHEKTVFAHWQPKYGDDLSIIGYYKMETCVKCGSTISKGFYKKQGNWFVKSEK